MIKEKLDKMVTESLERILENSDVRETLVASTDVDKLMKVLLKTGEFQALLAGIRGLTDNVAMMNHNINEIVSTLRIHQAVIENMKRAQESLLKYAKSTKTGGVDLSLPNADAEKPTKPN